MVNWSELGAVAPGALEPARLLAHHGVQWVSRAARANLAAASDDSHSNLGWDDDFGALVSHKLPGGDGPVRVELRLADLSLFVRHDGGEPVRIALNGQNNAAIGIAFDAALAALGLAPATPVTLPYEMPAHEVAGGGSHAAGGAAEPLAELSRWFAVAAEILEEFAGRHHFDIATLVVLEEGDAETARSVGVGLSPGDETYRQPYFYINPWPHLATDDLPNLPAPGHWHTEGFVGAIATGEEVLALADRRAGLAAFVEGAFAASVTELGL
jgi:hypothetical protein